MSARRTAARLALLGTALLALGSQAAQRRPPGTLFLALESGFIQTDGTDTRGGSVGLMAGWRFTDQLAITGLGTGAVSHKGPLSSVAFGLQALFDSTPVAPFLDIQMVLMGPQSTSGYSLAVRLGLGADWKLTPAFALGLAVRTLSPLDSVAAARVAGTEIVLRFVLMPGQIK